jgi:hypothetical protein
MTAVAARVQSGINVRDTGHKVTTYKNCYALLKYYLNCCSGVGYKLPADMINYEQSHDGTAPSITDAERLRDLCITYRPDGMDEFAEVASTGDGCGNRFLEITATRELTALGISSSVIAALRRKQSATIEIMVFTRSWVQGNYYEPLATLQQLINEYYQPKRSSDSDLCLLA